MKREHLALKEHHLREMTPSDTAMHSNSDIESLKAQLTGLISGTELDEAGASGA